MNDFLNIVEKYKGEFFSFVNYIIQQDKKLLVLGDIVDYFNAYTEKFEIENEDLADLTRLMQEAVVVGNTIYVEVRIKIGVSEFYYINQEELSVEEISIMSYLQVKERFVDSETNESILTLNFAPFYKNVPLVRDAKSIGSGFDYLNKFLSSQMFNDSTKWKADLFNFLRIHNYQGQQLLINGKLKSVAELERAVKKGIKIAESFNEGTPFKEFSHKLHDLGFAPGLGKDAGTVAATFNLLDDLLNSPDNKTLKEFIARIPMIFNIAILSPHGFFAQENVLGMPDTGGQVVYILDQVKALEKSLYDTLQNAGLDITPKILILTRLIPEAQNTTCNQRLEKVMNTKDCWILRVPFRTHNKKVTDNWISRFEIWPYLEEFAEDSYLALKAEFNGRPDLVIGNYSDGNLVAYLLSKKYGVTMSCIAHALEKSKYLYSDLYWNEMEDHYNFSLQFTADLIAMNSSDFQIASTFQEIAGTDTTVGQYESHRHFSLPGLFRVENGINLHHPKFNIISPGVNENIYFPYYEENRRILGTRNELEDIIFKGKEDPEVLGKLADPDKIPIFSMARLDSNKNLTSLVKWYGESPELQEVANLVIIAGKVNINDSSDKEEIEEIKKMHDYIGKYNLMDKIKWIGKLMRKDEAGEIYRLIAEHKGVFIQPALFEGFGLTVLEAMTSGLPVIATQYGGPLEIIQNGKNGYHIDPVNAEESTEVILDVIKQIKSKSGFWKKLSDASIQRVEEAYNWRLYSRKLLDLAKIYGFWKFTSGFEREDLNAYLEVIYQLLFKPRAKSLLEKHNRM